MDRGRKRRGGGTFGRDGKLGYAESENETERWMKNGFQQPDKGSHMVMIQHGNLWV